MNLFPKTMATTRLAALSIPLLLGVVACNDSTVAEDASETTDTTDGTTDATGGGEFTGGPGGDGGGAGGPGGGTDISGDTANDLDIASYKDLSLGDCQQSAHIDSLVCAVDQFLATLDDTQTDTVRYNWSESTSKSTWSNLPAANVARNGLALGAMSDESQAAALLVARAALSEQGYQDLLGILAADDFLQQQANGYGSELYYLAIFGNPTATEDWMLQFGGHHLAHNIVYLSGTAHPVPHHIAVEPKAAFVLNSETYSPMLDDGEAFAAVYDSMDSSQLSAAYLSGQSYGDVVMGPDNGSTTLDLYPDQEGVLVSSLSAAQQNLVTEAISQWVGDYAEEVSDVLIADYTSSAAYANTYVAWAGTESAGVDVDVNGTYMRIDGPRVWIEVACQGGVIISGETHYHTIYRDKAQDYGNSL